MPPHPLTSFEIQKNNFKKMMVQLTINKNG